MNSLGVSEIKRSTMKYYRRKIEAEFGNALRILPVDSGKLLVIPGNVTVHDLAKINQCLAKELEERKRRGVSDNTS